MRARPTNKGRSGPGRPRTARGHQGNKRYSCPWINTQIIAASETGGLQQLVSTILAHLPQMNLVNLSTAIHRLAKLTANDPGSQAELRQHPVLEELLQATSLAFTNLDVSEAQPQSLSNVAWSLATLRLLHRQLIQVVSTLAVANIASFKPFELSTMLWALAKLGTIESTMWCVKPVFQAAAVHIMKQVQYFGFRCLATTAWAFATARQRHARLFRSIAAQMVPMVHAANCQEMANTAWAFGTVDFHDNQLFTELAEKAIQKLDSFKPQELSNILWGFGTNGFFHEAFFSSSSMAAQRMDLQAQHLANILWAFARVRPRHPVTQATARALLPLCVVQLETFKPQEVSSTALAVAKAFGIGDETERSPAPVQRGMMPALPPQVQEFFGAVTPWAMMRLHEFSSQSLANTVSAYSMVQVPGADAFFAAIGQEVSGRYNSLEPTALLHLLKAFSAAPREVCFPLVQLLAGGVAHHVQDLRQQEVQTLSRICAMSLGFRHNRELNYEELRSCCLAIAAGESGRVALSALGTDTERPAVSSPVMGLRDDWSEPSPSLLELPVGPPGHTECLATGPCSPPELPMPMYSATSSMYPGLRPPVPPVVADLARPSRAPRNPPLYPPVLPPRGPPPPPMVLGSAALAQAQARGRPPEMAPRCKGQGPRVLSTSAAASAWPDAAEVPVPLYEADIEAIVPGAFGPCSFDAPDLATGPSVAVSSVLDMTLNNVMADLPNPVTGPAHGMGSVSVVPHPHSNSSAAANASAAARLFAQRFAAARAGPLSTVEEMSPTMEVPYVEGRVEGGPFWHQTDDSMPSMPKGRGSREASGSSPRMRAPGPQTHPWRCSVKNSFLHVELGGNSDDDKDDSYDGTSSQRSSSVPSRFDHEEMREDRRRHSDQSTKEEWTRRHPDLDNLDFDWGTPQRRSRGGAPEVPYRTGPVPSSPGLGILRPDCVQALTHQL